MKRAAGLLALIGAALGAVWVMGLGPEPIGYDHADGHALITCNVNVAGHSYGVTCPPIGSAVIDQATSTLRSIPDAFNRGLAAFVGVFK